jgi:hypothetical protein
MKRLYLVGIILFLYFLVSQLPCILQGYCIGSPASGIFMLASTLIAIAFGLYAFRFHGFRNIHGRALLLLSLAVIMLFIGNFIMTLSVTLLGISDPPAEAVVFWLMQYPFYIAGLYSVWSMMKSPISKKRLAAMYLLVAAISIFSILAFITSIPKSMDSNSILGQVSVFGDMLTLDMLAIIAMHSLGGKVFRLWSLILLSVFVLSIAHIIISVSTPFNLAVGLNLMGIGFLFMAFGFFYNTEMFREMAAKKKLEPLARKYLKKEAKK